MRRPKIAGALTTSNAPPHGRTPGALGRAAHSESVERGYGPAEASQSAPAACDAGRVVPALLTEETEDVGAALVVARARTQG